MSKASERAYEIIRKNILSGEFSEGSHLKEEELAEICQVSRTPIRDALRKLAADHYVEFVPNHGTFVYQWSQDDIEEIFSLRVLLEGYAARRAAMRATPEQIAQLTNCYNNIAEVLKKPGIFDKESFFIENRRFHQILRDAGKSERLSSSLNRLVQQPVVMKTVISFSREHFARSNEQHHEIIEALKSRDSDWAEAIMRSHIHAAFNVYRQTFTRDDEDNPIKLEKVKII